MNSQENIGILIFIITVACLIIQGRGIMKGKYDSSLAAWTIWSCIFIFLFIICYLQEGWSIISLFLCIQTIGHLLMIPITYRYVEKRFSFDDWMFLGIAILGFVVWGYAYHRSDMNDGNLLQATLIGVLGQIVADAAGAILFIKIIIKHPYRQPKSAWIINSFIYPITAFGTYLNHEAWTGYLFIGYAFIMYTTLLIILIRQRRKIL